MALLVACLTLACPPPPPDGSGPLETEEVGPGIDAAIRPEDDPHEVRRVEVLSGVLPDDFPAGLPLPEPATLVDAGSDETGRFADLLTESGSESVRRDLERRLKGAGWSVERDGDGLTARRDGRSVRLGIGRQGGGTLVRVQWPAGG